MEQVSELYQNERFFGIIWKGPVAALDRAEWTDGTGEGIAVTKPPTEQPQAWEVVVTPGTDPEGWQYGTVFKHLEYKRPGGRSTPRFGDVVRRRLWRRRPEAAEAADAASLGSSSGSGESVDGTSQDPGAAPIPPRSDSRRRRDAPGAQEDAAQRRAIKGFLKMVYDLLERRRWWSLAPWDPSALYQVYQKHQQVYATLQVQAYERRLFTAEDEAPLSALQSEGGRTLLQDLLCAGMHSRAAYGYAMAAGHISTVTGYIKLKTLAPFTFDAVGGVSVEANNDSVAELTGIDPGDILLAEWSNSTYRPCHYVAVDRANRCLVLSIRGSLEVGDLLSDMAAHPMEASLGGRSGWVHEGIFSAATYIHCTTGETLERAAEQFPGWPLLITGHSLGGGVAALLTLLIHEAGVPRGMGAVGCVTIGTAAVMSRPMADACRPHVTSVILAADIIPHLSYASVETLLLELNQSSLLPRAAKGLGKKLSSVLGLGKDSGDTKVSEAVAKRRSEGKTQAQGEWKSVRRAAGSSPRRPADELRVLLKDEEALAAAAEATSHTLEQTAREGGASQAQGSGADTAVSPRPSPRLIPVIEMSDPDAPPQAGGEGSQVEDSDAADQEPSSATDLLPYLGGMEDGGGATSAIASAGVRDREMGTSPRSVSQPAHLYPPGRIIWIFPADEDKSSLDGSTAGEEQGPPAHAGEQDTGGEAPRKEPEAPEPSPSNGDGAAQVSMEEAVEEVEAKGQGPSSKEVAAAARESGDPRATRGKAVPVAVEAKATSFERLLLLPDCFNDHLPDRYIEVLQQL
ncbi:Sn1-specific diacylglycerol lipase beta [Auxenochlorella protothecoides]|uniref:sn-1-specific diacylglycerol lipase n=2 Tax=Auxenochlorella protothecoides TaxID=3075 RepID=A0A087SP74_AUXPR|nr:Sn1-specific diacylglycerol lipase beta [Auxenochlorella protothecoides]KFM27528.1 Sn1-specific diacylglycerol lipase beta [Auxenochlorella protothecoides]RMZ52363.1 hypothetical protein APUTEX25_000638 [Auxenochlorella protothecoides]|eukprot:RMZ52363.1 hypothetical protein APUTEX25_000638 [Auxenochlorella protothecoides]